MIEGFKFDLTSAEVVDKINALIARRKRRLEAVEREGRRAAERPIDDYQERIDKHLEEKGASPYDSGGPKPDAEAFRDSAVHAFKVTAEGHRNAILRLEFIRDHLVKDETFRVDWMELGHLFPDSRDHGHFPVCFGHEHDEMEEDGLDYLGLPETKKKPRRDEE